MAVDVSHLGITDDEARDLLKLGAAVCVNAEVMAASVWFALRHFEDKSGLVNAGVRAWRRIDKQDEHADGPA